MFATGLKCTGCGTRYGLRDRVLVCSDCGRTLDVEYDLEKLQCSLDRGSLKGRVHSLWRYREFLPIARDEYVVSMGEGLTPLNKANSYGPSIGITSVFLKLDYLNPTGSFKDRGTTVNVSHLKNLEIASVMDDSSGNAGSSLAAYCASAGIHCTIYVPANVPREKLVQAQIYGARIVEISGSRSNVARAAEKAWKTSGPYYASHNLSAFFLEGMKTVAYEIAEALEWQVPDHVVFPVGGGTHLLGAWKGFQELVKLGWIDRIPRLHCVQSQACMPIVEAFRKGSAEVERATEATTIAGGLRISNPPRGGQVIEALKRTGGNVAATSDEAILRHQRLLARREGIFAEPTSCAALAGLEKLREMDVIDDRESVVVPITGFGLKDTRSAAMSLAR